MKEKRKGPPGRRGGCTCDGERPPGRHPQLVVRKLFCSGNGASDYFELYLVASSSSAGSLHQALSF
jgi:hypothetical protein